jgi:hypothetical protein
MSREHELFEELRKARRSLAGAKGAEKEARAVILDRKAARLRAEALVEEILSEVETGKTGRPVLDAIAVAGRGAGKAPADETADERQRGPTAVPSSVSFGAKDFAALPAMAEKLKAAAKGRPKAERADRREVVIGSDRALPPPAEIVIDAMAVDKKNPTSPRRLPDWYSRPEVSERLVIPIQNDHTKLDCELLLALHRFDDSAAKWRVLITTGASNDAIRDLISESFGTEGSSSSPERVGNRLKGSPKSQFWKAYGTSGDVTIKGAALVDAVRRLLMIPTIVLQRADHRDVVIGSDGAVTAAAEIVIDATAIVERQVTSTSADLDAALQAACYPIAWRGDNSPWPALKEHGCDDAKILEVLRALWPAGDRYQIRSGPDKFGHTTQGGAVPKFWLGHRIGKDQRPLLSGLELADRVRIALDIPRASVPPERTVWAVYRKGKGGKEEHVGGVLASIMTEAQTQAATAHGKDAYVKPRDPPRKRRGTDRLPPKGVTP